MHLTKFCVQIYISRLFIYTYRWVNSFLSLCFFFSECRYSWQWTNWGGTSWLPMGLFWYVIIFKKKNNRNLEGRMPPPAACHTVHAGLSRCCPYIFFSPLKKMKYINFFWERCNHAVVYTWCMQMYRPTHVWSKQLNLCFDIIPGGDHKDQEEGPKDFSKKKWLSYLWWTASLCKINVGSNPRTYFEFQPFSVM